jgi:hypothetical protein
MSSTSIWSWTLLVVGDKIGGEAGQMQPAPPLRPSPYLSAAVEATDIVRVDPFARCSTTPVGVSLAVGTL